MLSKLAVLIAEEGSILDDPEYLMTPEDEEEDEMEEGETLYEDPGALLLCVSPCC